MANTVSKKSQPSEIKNTTNAKAQIKDKIKKEKQYQIDYTGQDQKNTQFIYAKIRFTNNNRYVKQTVRS